VKRLERGRVLEFDQQKVMSRAQTPGLIKISGLKIARLTISNFRGIKSAEFHFDGHALMIVDSEKQRNGQGCLEATILADPVAILKTFCPNCWMNFSRIVINSSRSQPRNMSVVDDLRIDDGTAQK
jgi:hypothetical protein